MTAGFHDYRVREQCSWKKQHYFMERNNTDHKMLNALHRMCFITFVISIDTYLHTQAYLEEPLTISGSAGNSD